MSVVTPTILSAGKVMDATYELLSIDVVKEVNRIANAQLTLVDGDIARQRFEISDAEFFKPGAEIEIRLRYEGQESSESSVFKGLVVRHGIESNGQDTRLTVDLKDPAFRLTQIRNSAVYRDQSDADIFRTIARRNGLKTASIDATQPRHQEIIQYYATDWDFLLSRAEAQGLLVVSDDGRLSATRVAVDGKPAHRFEYGMSGIYDFSMEADAGSQRGTITGAAWDIANQSLTPAVTGKDFKIAQGNLSAGPLAKIMGATREALTDPVSLEKAELQAWADARLKRSRMALLRGTLSVPGISEIKPLAIVEIAGIGKRFNGNALVTGVRHRVNVEGWVTDIQFGLAPDGFVRHSDIADAPAAGLLPPVSGLRIGVVAPYDDDPSGELRVKTVLPGLGDEKDETLWARLAAPEAGKQRGYFFRPEPGDEVVLGFLNDDPRQAIILGALYSSYNSPPDEFAPVDEKNLKKGILTRSGLKIEMTDDKKPKLLIETPGSNRILLDDDGQSIELEDQHGNFVVMDSGGITVKSAKDLKIAASGNVEISGSQVDVK